MQYIILENKAATLRRAFKVLRGPRGAYRPELRKTGDAGWTVGGVPDYEFGPDLQQWRYTIKILEADAGDSVSHVAGSVITETSTPLGSLADIKTFFGYNTSSTLPLNLMDVDETEHEVVFQGGLAQRLRGYRVTGDGAAYDVPITMRKADT